MLLVFQICLLEKNKLNKFYLHQVRGFFYEAQDYVLTCDSKAFYFAQEFFTRFGLGLGPGG